MENTFHSNCLAFAYLAALFLVYYLFFYKRHKNLLTYVKYVLVPITLIGGFTLFYIGYNCTHLHNEISDKILMALYSTARLFILGNDLVEIQCVIHKYPLLFQLFSLVMVTAFIIFASIFLHLIGERWRNHFKLWFSNPEEVFIFLGINGSSLSLANDLQREKKRLIIFIRDIDKKESLALYEIAKKNGALVLSNESLLNKFLLKNEESMICFTEEILVEQTDIFHDNSFLSKLRIKRIIQKNESHLFFLADKEQLNMHVAKVVLNELSDIQLRKDVTLHIRTLSDELKDEYDKSLRVENPHITLRFFDDSDIASRQLVKKYPPVRFITKDTNKALATSNFKVLIVGFGMIGSSALRKLIETGQFVGSTFKAVITDRLLDSLKGRFENRYPGLISAYNLEFVQTEMGHADFFNLVKKHINDLNYVVVALGNDALNVQVSLDIKLLANRLNRKDLKIITHVSNNENFKDLFDSSGTLNAFGKNKDVFTEAIVVRRSIEKTARKISDYYNSLADESKKQPWDKLSRIKQLSNISAAEHIYTKLELAGLSLPEVKNCINEDAFRALLGDERISNLAQVEHLRWNALYFSNGWAKWELKDIPEDIKKTSNEESKQHACLVNWEEIKTINKHFGDNYYHYDIENVINIFQLITEDIFIEDKLSNDEYE